MTQNWYAIAVHPKKEGLVEHQLKSAGIHAVCPRYVKRVRHARKCRDVATPLFPGYLFAQLEELSGSWRQVNWMQGSLGLITVGSRPSALEQSFLNQFLSRVDSNGVVRFNQDFEIGDSVRTIGGPFDRLIGKVLATSEQDRVKILIEALNRKVEMTLPRTAVIRTV